MIDENFEFIESYDVIAHYEELIGRANRVSSEAKLEEERRIFYVALTRAKQQLYIISYRNKGSMEQRPSELLADVREHLLTNIEVELREDEEAVENGE